MEQQRCGLVMRDPEAYASLAGTTREAIEMAERPGDADTADLFTEVSRGLDKSLWFLEAHLQSSDDPSVKE